MVLDKLGDGAYSKVYKVERQVDKQMYALKKVKIGQMAPKDRDNAINEVRILSSISHPNVIQYKEAFVDPKDELLCIVMQYADSGDLLKMILERKRMKVHFRESQVWRVLIETIHGLRAMHELRVMHRDIKSANIFLFNNSGENPRVETENDSRINKKRRHGEIASGDNAVSGFLFQSKLGDMNVSKVTANHGLNYTQTGTPYYASPEVWKDEPYSFKSDVWSLGCVIYEMLALKPPFNGKDMDQLFKRVCKGTFSRIPEHYSNDIWQVVQLMLRVDPEKRPSCQELIESTLFKHYSAKLANLESVDKSFQETIDSTSPARHELNQITNQLLKSIAYPKSIEQLSGILPKCNYGPYGAPIAFSKTTKMIKNNHYSHSTAELGGQQILKNKVDLTDKSKQKLTTSVTQGDSIQQ